MATRYYNYEDAINKCSKGSSIDYKLQDLQSNLKELNILLKECEDKFHGKGYQSKIYKSYDNMYQTIGKARKNGSWDVIYQIIRAVSEAKAQAENDLRDYEAEVERERREEEERRAYEEMYSR